MRIGLEMFGKQTASRHRGIGRYVRNLAASLSALARHRGHDLVLYAQDGPSVDGIPTSADVPLRLLRPEPALREAVGRLVRENPDRLDVLVLANPLELTPGYDIPGRPAEQSLALTAVVYDLIPWVFPDEYLRCSPDPLFARRFFWALERLRGYDLLLAISDATRDDVIRYLNLLPTRVIAIGTAGGDHGIEGCFHAGTPDDEPLDRAAVARLGLTRPFVLSVGASDPRKNLTGLIEAFARLPRPLRDAHQLAIAGALGPGQTEAVARQAERLGLRLPADLAPTGPVDDRTLCALYRRCAAFAFPSKYEGFGLPILEAMACGAAVVAGRNSSQVEAAGTAALLVNAGEPGAIASGLARVLGEPALAQALREAGPAHARRFSWEAVAARTLQALEGLARRSVGLRQSHGPRVGIPDPSLPTRGERSGEESTARRASGSRPAASRPRVAFVSPLPPHPSGVADYAGALAEALAAHASVDLFYDAGELPLARFRSRGLGSGCYDYRLFARLARLRSYDAVLYQMDNSPAHAFLYDLLLGHPGVVVFHDLALGSFHYERTSRLGLVAGAGAFLAELEYAHPGRAPEFGPIAERYRDDPGALVRALGREGLDMNRRVLERAKVLVVHSQDAAARAARVVAGVANRTFVVPHGAAPCDRPSDPESRAQAREWLGLPGDALLVGQFGIVEPSKLNAEGIEAFAPVAAAVPVATLLVVGVEADGGHARHRAEALGLADRVRFWGRADDAEFRTLADAVDLGVCLRRPPTNGESSATLLHLLRAGVATVVTDVGSFAEYPDDVVRKIPWRSASEDHNDREGMEALRRAVFELCHEPAARAAMGRAAWEHVRTRHAWPLVANAYAAIIDRCRQGRAETPVYRGPHRTPRPTLRSADDRGES